MSQTSSLEKLEQVPVQAAVAGWNLCCQPHRPFMTPLLPRPTMSYMKDLYYGIETRRLPEVEHTHYLQRNNSHQISVLLS